MRHFTTLPTELSTESVDSFLLAVLCQLCRVERGRNGSAGITPADSIVDLWRAPPCLKTGAHLIERVRESAHHFAHLGLRDDEWWAKRDGVLDSTHNQAMFMRALKYGCACLAQRIELFPGVFISHQLHTGYKAFAAHLPHQRMVRQFTQAGL